MGEEREFDNDSYCEEKRANEADLQHSWANFENSLKTQSRLFNNHSDEPASA